MLLKDVKIKLSDIKFRNDPTLTKIIAKSDLPKELTISGSNYAAFHKLDENMEITDDFEQIDYDNYYAENYVTFLTGWRCVGLKYTIIEPSDNEDNDDVMSTYTVDKLIEILTELSKMGHGGMEVFVGKYIPLTAEELAYNFYENKLVISNRHYDKKFTRITTEYKEKMKNMLSEYIHDCLTINESR